MSHCHTLIETLRQRGYRVTPQRQMIVEVIADSGRHMTVEEVFAAIQVRTRAVNIATVYRVLDLLVAEGLASRADLGDGRLVYATRRHGPHLHLVCRRCGRVIETDGCQIEPLGKELQERYGFAADLQHICLSGLCADCRQVPGPEPAGQ
jgi:Fur family ferric uptake transcriptional regulator